MSGIADLLKDHKLAVYSSSGCPDSARLRQWMLTKKVPHEEILIDEDPGAAAKLERETGKQAVPFILIDEKTWVRGYHREERSRFSESKLLAELGEAIRPMPPGPHRPHPAR